ncbi:MAG: PAS domain-containing protein [Proteobacteria bacterium]|nr:PAS domain-containing protein [Pseudomonadota bacterium]
MDFAAVFEKAPGLYLVIDTHFDIAAVNDAYCAATRFTRDAIVGHPLFEVLADNSASASDDCVTSLRESLLRVLKTRAADRMDVQRYDIGRGAEGGARYWSPLNVPVLGDDGYVKWIIHSVEDVTDTMAAAS